MINFEGLGARPHTGGGYLGVKAKVVVPLEGQQHLAPQLMLSMKLLDEALGSPIPPAEHYVTEDVTRMMEVTRPVDSTVHKKIL